MPKKSRRIAARQAQLSGRAKRERTHGPAGVPGTNTAPQTTGTVGDGGVSAGKRPYTPSALPEAPTMESQRFVPASAARVRGRTPYLPPIETYFAPELRRIAVGMGMVATILVVLMFVLR